MSTSIKGSSAANAVVEQNKINGTLEIWAASTDCRHFCNNFGGCGLARFYIALVTTQRDVTALWAYIRLLVLIKRYERNNVSVGDIFQ
ncbi:unnamed protein product [Ceratitis capitata]|uniref:(Mediterranean fruit fly) hypothetical protein n=1 Tax=Ceratitis capitata TaxID=7213 RepID=A0A811UWV7_CERCA|nr:unnamed protein product [Ceratitis capitata]